MTQNIMKRAYFRNFTEEDFIYFWNGKQYTFTPGQREDLPLAVAQHFAKHLTNKILIDRGDVQYTSPKRPQDVPKFMELFNQACLPIGDEEFDAEIGILSDDAKKPVSSEIEVIQPTPIDPYDASQQTVGPGGESQVVGDDADFEGMEEPAQEPAPQPKAKRGRPKKSAK